MSNIEVQDPEQKRKAAIELANAYREMMAMFGWKHFKGVILNRIRFEASQDVDSVPLETLTVAHEAHARGIRKALDQIDAEINWILNGNEVITRNAGG